MSRAFVLIALTVILGACELDARRENMELSQQNEELKMQLRLSTEYIEDVTAIIDQVQRNLQRIKDREGMIGKISLTSEGATARAVNVRKELESSISDIDAYISDTRKKMELLAERIQESEVRIGSLERLVENLNVTVKQKEEDIAHLKEQISLLERDVADLQGQIVVKDAELKTKADRIEEQAEAIQSQEEVIKAQEQAAATAFFVADTRDRLKDKGLIFEKRSGFLGLGRSTKVGDIAESLFRRVPKDETKIEIGRDIDDIEIVSAHKDRPDLYRFEKSNDGMSLNIQDTQGFWALSEYLIIVTSD